MTGASLPGWLHQSAGTFLIRKSFHCRSRSITYLSPALFGKDQMCPLPLWDAGTWGPSPLPLHGVLPSPGMGRGSGMHRLPTYRHLVHRGGSAPVDGVTGPVHRDGPLGPGGEKQPVCSSSKDAQTAASERLVAELCWEGHRVAMRLCTCAPWGSAQPPLLEATPALPQGGQSPKDLPEGKRSRRPSGPSPSALHFWAPGGHVRGLSRRQTLTQRLRVPGQLCLRPPDLGGTLSLRAPAASLGTQG